MTEPRFAADMLRAFVERVERLETEIAELNSDKSDLFKEAKGNGFDVKALKAVIAYRRKDPNERLEHEAIVETYLHSLGHLRDDGTENAPRACARTTPVTIAPQRPVQTQPAIPASGTERLQQQIQARVAAENYPELPTRLDRRPSQ